MKTIEKAGGNLGGGATAGPLIVHPDNPRYLRDTTGKTILLAGLETQVAIQDRPPDVAGTGTLAGGWSGWLSKLITHRINYTRLMTFESTSFVSWSPGTGNITPATWYKRSSTPGADDGGNKYDLDQFNEAQPIASFVKDSNSPFYFTRLRSRLLDMRAVGIYASVPLFQGWTHFDQGGFDPFPGHPFKTSNNVNGLTCANAAAFVGLGAAIKARQEAYVDHLLAFVGDLDNVIWETSNEESGTLACATFLEYWVAYLKARSSKLVCHNGGQFTSFSVANYKTNLNADVWGSAADIGTPIASDGAVFQPEPSAKDPSGANASYNYDPPAWSQGVFPAKVIVADIDHMGCEINMNTAARRRAWPWKCFCRGLHPMWLDQDGLDSATFEDARLNLTLIADVSALLELSTMTPQNALSSASYCLASATQLVVWCPSGAAVNVNLTGKPGTFTLTWYNAVTGAVSAGGTVAGGASRTITPPSAVDYGALLTV